MGRQLGLGRGRRLFDGEFFLQWRLVLRRRVVVLRGRGRWGRMRRRQLTRGS
ncbi:MULTISPECIES: hypothetical protein [Streptomyces]|uniref:Uncharacterized protein n=1 Tax=Streptomyces liliifuscus TaxID=2797636 RepID=A0A7T7I7L2_9ACTN|nr:hypothetical protein [Streptomyces liliifuscus]QQM42386.1 hypothetical protein JEQ17_25105 [Streptomyces liliifuscus]